MKTKTAIRNDSPALLLRVGLAVVFIYAAVSATRSPQDWVGYLPHFATAIIAAGSLLKIFSVAEFGLALWLLSGKYVRYAGLLAFLLLAGIILSNLTLLPISFRDIGLAFAALALAATDWK